jgi:dipeptidyl aminopeptidase/acylaminoacyl peptidase
MQDCLSRTIARFAAGLGLALTLGTAAWAADAPSAARAALPAPPADAFFGRPTMASPTLSPSGRWMAVLAAPATPGRMRLVVLDTTEETPPQTIAAFERYDIDFVRWVSDDHLIFRVSDDQERGNRGKGDALATVRRDGTGLRLIIKREWETQFAARGGKAPLEANFDYLAPGAPGSNTIIVGEHHYDDNTWDLDRVTPYIYDVADGSRRLLLKQGPPHPAVQSWGFDAQGRARLATASEKGDLIYFYADAAGQWRQIGRYPRLKADFVPEHVDDDDQLIVSTRRKADGVSSWHRFDLANGRVDPEPLIATPYFDVEASRVLDGQGRTVGYRVLTDGEQTVWLTTAMKEIQARVDRALPGRTNWLQCRPCDAPKSVLVFSSAPNMPGEILHLQPQTGKWQRLGPVRPALEGGRSGTVEMVRMQARDGLDLPVWVTRPTGSAGQALPTVVLVHGGPWARGRDLSWKANSQFLASRGYLVIEPEFRGGTGFGEKHFRAGWKQWGRAMQDDIADALDTAVKLGWADKDRVCIAGASYGGYATLIGLARQGDLFRCGVAWVAVTDPRLLFSVHWSDMSQAGKRYTMPEMIGDPVADAAALAAVAPIELVGQIKRPLLLAYGGRDMRVPLVHGESLRAKLAAAGRPPEWVLYDDEGHGWRRPQNQVDFWNRVERFLQTHIGNPAPASEGPTIRP